MSELREILHQIGSEYSSARTEDFTDHPIGLLLRKSLPELIRTLLAEFRDEYSVVGSCGQGRWAEIPWLSIMDSLVTTSTTRGYYVVYLFSSDLDAVYLCMGQGVTAIKEEFGAARQTTILQHRADLIRARVPDYTPHFTDKSIELDASTTLGRSYGPGAAFSKRYATAALPSESVLISDLLKMINLYRQLVLAGGVDLIEDKDQQFESELSLNVEEKKQFREHRRIEGRIDSSKVKRIQGYKCKVCGFDFEEVYGELGKGFIEAHHLQPYSELKVGQKRRLDLKKDFAVLCANCHRMAHKLEDSSDIMLLKEVIHFKYKK